jgi:hypothetical protein
VGGRDAREAATEDHYGLVARAHLSPV